MESTLHSFKINSGSRCLLIGLKYIVKPEIYAVWFEMHTM